MVTPKELFVHFFVQVSLPKNSNDFLQCIIKKRSSSSMVVCSFAKWKSRFYNYNEWKSRFYNHKLSFKHKRYSNKTTLSSYMWYLESVSSETPNLKWSILRCVPPYSNISKKCLLCLYEKLEIVPYQNLKELLDKRSELDCKCRYANKFLLKNYISNDFR